VVDLNGHVADAIGLQCNEFGDIVGGDHASRGSVCEFACVPSDLLGAERMQSHEFQLGQVDDRRHALLPTFPADHCTTRSGRSEAIYRTRPRAVTIGSSAGDRTPLGAATTAVTALMAGIAVVVPMSKFMKSSGRNESLSLTFGSPLTSI
jgi:hypothetical protein